MMQLPVFTPHMLPRRLSPQLFVWGTAGAEHLVMTGRVSALSATTAAVVMYCRGERGEWRFWSCSAQKYSIPHCQHTCAIHTHTHTHKHTQKHEHTNTKTHTQSHTYTHMLPFTHTRTHTHAWMCDCASAESHWPTDSSRGQGEGGVGAKTANLYWTGRECLLFNKTEKDAISEDYTFSTTEEYIYENKNISVSTVPWWKLLSTVPYG